MRRALFAAALSLAVPTLAMADEIVNTAPTDKEIGRYAIARAVDVTVRVDTATGASWFLCSRKNKAGWCKASQSPALPSGPSGRYRVIEASPLLMIDTITGRSWSRCELPTPEKGYAWCAIED